jgi:hypothetical protein
MSYTFTILKKKKKTQTKTILKYLLRTLVYTIAKCQSLKKHNNLQNDEIKIQVF